MQSQSLGDGGSRSSAPAPRDGGLGFCIPCGLAQIRCGYWIYARKAPISSISQGRFDHRGADRDGFEGIGVVEEGLERLVTQQMGIGPFHGAGRGPVTVFGSNQGVFQKGILGIGVVADGLTVPEDFEKCHGEGRNDVVKGPASPSTLESTIPAGPMLTLPTTLRLTAAQFAEVCAANPEAVLELDADGHLIEMTPTGGETGSRNQTLGALLWLAVRQGGLPLKVFDSSTGFELLGRLRHYRLCPQRHEGPRCVRHQVVTRTYLMQPD